MLRAVPEVWQPTLIFDGLFGCTLRGRCGAEGRPAPWLDGFSMINARRDGDGDDDGNHSSDHWWCQPCWWGWRRQSFRNCVLMLKVMLVMPMKMGRSRRRRGIVMQ